MLHIKYYVLTNVLQVLFTYTWWKHVFSIKLRLVLYFYQQVVIIWYNIYHITQNVYSIYLDCMILHVKIQCCVQAILFVVALVYEINSHLRYTVGTIWANSNEEQTILLFLTLDIELATCLNFICEPQSEPLMDHKNDINRRD